MNLPSIVVVTGTDTGVGKTVTTAAIAAALLREGRTVAVYKPCQTGNSNGDSDAAEIVRLAGPVKAIPGAVLQEPLAPRAAAEIEGVTLPPATEHASRIAELAETHQHVLVEGAGGVLVELDEDANTLADLALLLRASGAEVGVVVVARAALGTLNHTALTLEALQRRGLAVLGVVLGSVPAQPTLAERDNMEVLAAGATPMIGAVPEGAPLLVPERFRAAAHTWLPGLQPSAPLVQSTPVPETGRPL